ncbi:MAG: FAD-dependent oxidoreductase [Rhizobiaceae bacterium]
MKRKRRIIAIAGAGIAGMTAALFLERIGFRVLLFEKAEAPASSGTGIQISPNAYRVLDELGLARSVSMVGFAPDAIDIRAGRSGRHLTRFELGQACLERHKAPYTTIHRVDLAHILQTACDDREDIEILRGLQVADLTVHANGLTLLCEREKDFSEHVVNAVIGADGAWSSLRKYVHDAEEPEFTGRIAWRVLVDIENADPAVSRTSTGLWLGQNSHLVHYPIRGGHVLNIIAITPWDKDYAPRRGWLNQTVVDDRVSAFDLWQPHLRELINTRANWGGWPIYATNKVGCFANGPLCLIGDAAHAMVPFAAQGGACAIEDAYVLASECAKSIDDLASAFQRFEKIRRPRVKKVMQLSNNNRRIYHMAPPMEWARNLVMKVTPQESMQRRMDWVYGWEPKSEDPPVEWRKVAARKLTGFWKRAEKKIVDE